MLKIIIVIPLTEVREMLNIKYDPKKLATKNPCAICGKEVKQGKGKLVHLTGNDEIVSYDGSLEGSIGFHPVGPECAKKLKINFAF